MNRLKMTVTCKATVNTSIFFTRAVSLDVKNLSREISEVHSSFHGYGTRTLDLFWYDKRRWITYKACKYSSCGNWKRKKNVKWLNLELHIVIWREKISNNEIFYLNSKLLINHFLDKNKSSACIKIVLKKNWIVKKVFKSWKMLKKM